MARDNRKIVNGVRVGRKVYGADHEDELAENATQEQLDRLKEKGAITGDWKATPKARTHHEPDARRDANQPKADKEPQHAAFGKPAKPSDK